MSNEDTFLREAPASESPGNNEDMSTICTVMYSRFKSSGSSLTYHFPIVDNRKSKVF